MARRITKLPVGKLQSLTDLEWELMIICWRLGPTSGKDIATAVRRNRHLDPHAQTIATILSRMAEKGYISVAPNPADGRSRIYSPIVPIDDTMREKIELMFQEDWTRDARFQRLLFEFLAARAPDSLLRVFEAELRKHLPADDTQ